MAGSSLTWREGLVRGIAQYAGERGNWHIYTAPEGAEHSVFFSKAYRWDGIIVRLTDPVYARRIARLGLPAVGIGSVRAPLNTLPRVKVNDEKMAALAARHLLDNGFRNFAYCGLQKKTMEDRGLAFAQQLAAQRQKCVFFTDFAPRLAEASWQRRQQALVRWLKSLPKPAGIYTWNADVACELVEACGRVNLNIPENVAIVSADNDKMKCEFCVPRISATEIPTLQMGYAAAALLDQIMSGQPAPDGALQIDPTGRVIVRESSNTINLKDRDVHLAMQFIRERFAENLTVSDIADSVKVSRRWLERHFQKVMGHSPHAALKRVRLDAARRLLLETDWPLKRVAEACGFTSAPYLVRVITAETGITPEMYRTRFKFGVAK